MTQHDTTRWNILIYGAGPMGSIIAARLHEAGHQVSVLARNERLAQLREHGVLIQEEGSPTLETARVQVVEALNPDDEYDLVIVVMRRNQASQILDTLAAAGNVPTFLFMVNSAAGPDAYVEALGAERVLLGFPYPGGERDGHVMQMVPVNENKTWKIPVGEVDGRVTERTRAVAQVLRSMRGYKVEIRRDMDAWLKNHVALLMTALAPAIYAAGISTRRLAATRDLLVLSVRGIREALRALHRAGVPLTPRSVLLVFFIPEPILVSIFAKRIQDPSLRSSLEGHPRAGRDELTFLAEELASFFRSRNIETPIFDAMRAYYDPETPPVPEGSQELRLRWTGVVALSIAMSALGLMLYGLWV